MTDELKEFTEQLGDRGHLSLLERRSGTVLVELEDHGRSERWYVNVKRGDLRLSKSLPQGSSGPDCTLRTTASTFQAIRTGRLNLMPALLRGLLSVEGDISLAVALQGLFRPSAGSAGEPVAGYAGRRS